MAHLHAPESADSALARETSDGADGIKYITFPFAEFLAVFRNVFGKYPSTVSIVIDDHRNPLMIYTLDDG